MQATGAEEHLNVTALHVRSVAATADAALSVADAAKQGTPVYTHEHASVGWVPLSAGLSAGP